MGEGTHHLYQGPTAVIAEGPTAAVWHHTPILEEVVVVSPKLALIRPKADVADWQDALTKQFRGRPELFIFKLVTGKRRNGQAWAVAIALASEIRQAQAAPSLAGLQPLELEFPCAQSVGHGSEPSFLARDSQSARRPGMGRPDCARV